MKIIALLCVLLSAMGCAKSKSDPAALTVALNWFPEMEHAGFYAAQVEGFFAEEGLNVTILPGGPDVPVIAQVASGKVDFGVENADNLLFGRAAGAPVVAVFAALQTSPRCILVHEESGIEHLKDLRNVTLAMSAKGAFSHYLKRHAALEGATVVPYSGSVAAFLARKDYAQQGYVFSEPFVASREGAKVRALLLADIGFNPYTSLLITSDAMRRDRPEVVAKLVHASAKGWRHYLKERAKTDALIGSLNPEMTPDVMDFGSTAMAPLVTQGLADESHIGHMTVERWTELIGQIESLDMIPKGTVRAEDVFTSEFLSAK